MDSSICVGFSCVGVNKKNPKGGSDEDLDG